MQQININELKSHPRNNEFFDDITGDKWEELLESIRKRVKDNKRGNIEPMESKMVLLIFKGINIARWLRIIRKHQKLKNNLHMKWECL